MTFFMARYHIKKENEIRSQDDELKNRLLILNLLQLYFVTTNYDFQRI